KAATRRTVCCTPCAKPFTRPCARSRPPTRPVISAPTLTTSAPISDMRGYPLWTGLRRLIAIRHDEPHNLSENPEATDKCHYRRDHRRQPDGLRLDRGTGQQPDPGRDARPDGEPRGERCHALPGS